LEVNLGSTWLMCEDKLKKSSREGNGTNGEVKWVIDEEVILLKMWWTNSKLNLCIMLNF
jgi:hypothetical protein